MSVELTSGEKPRIQVSLRRAAALAIRIILQRSFRRGQRALSSSGKPVRRLTAKYSAYKSGNVQYRTAASKKAAATRRKNSGYGSGKGPVVELEGGTKRRISPRAPEADQMLTGLTARGMGVTREAAGEIAIGFRTERSRRVASGLQERNQFFGLSGREKQRVRTLFTQEVDRFTKGLKIRGTTVIVDVPIGRK